MLAFAICRMRSFSLGVRGMNPSVLHKIGNMLRYSFRMSQRDHMIGPCYPDESDIRNSLKAFGDQQVIRKFLVSDDE